MAKGKAASKIVELQKALKGSVGTHQMQMLKYQIEHIEFISNTIVEIDAEIKKTEFASEDIELLSEIPGIGIRSAERIIAETCVNMEQFISADHFCSWAGVVPQCNESAGKKKSTRIRKGNRFLKSTIVECARAAIRHKDSYFYAKYSKIAASRGGKRALMAIAHSMLLVIYHMLKSKEHFRDLGNNYFTSINAEKIKNKNIKSLENLGFEVSLMPQA